MLWLHRDTISLICPQITSNILSVYLLFSISIFARLVHYH